MSAAQRQLFVRNVGRGPRAVLLHGGLLPAEANWRELEAERLVSRRPDPDDRRRALVELTAPGRTTLQTERVRREGWLARAIARDLSEEEQAILMDAVPLLRRLAES